MFPDSSNTPLQRLVFGGLAAATAIPGFANDLAADAYNAPGNVYTGAQRITIGLATGDTAQLSAGLMQTSGGILGFTGILGATQSIVVNEISLIESQVANTGARATYNVTNAGVPSTLRSGQIYEAEQLAGLGVGKNTTVFRPTSDQVETATFKAIVGDVQYTKGGQLKGTIFDSSPANGYPGYLELKGGTSELNSTYQLRLQTYKATTERQPYTIQTTRPVNPAFQQWLDFWGVNVAKP